jgi:AGZA family xanthine/uracil permease-like MFS transporter
MMYRVRGAILIGIFLTSIISWPRPTSVTYFPHTAAGDALFDYFKQVVAFHKLEKVGNVIDVRFAVCIQSNELELISAGIFSTTTGM